MFRRVFTRVSSHVVHHSGGYRRGVCTSKEGNKSADFAEKGKKGQNEDTRTGQQYLYYAYLWTLATIVLTSGGKKYVTTREEITGNEAKRGAENGDEAKRCAANGTVDGASSRE